MILGTYAEILDVTWGIIVIPILFMLIFKHIKIKYYILVGTFLIIVSLLMLLYGSQSIVILLVYIILFAFYVFIAKQRFFHPFSRFIFVLLNILITGSVYIFQLGYCPVSLKKYRVIDDYRLNAPWNMVLVEKDSMLGIVEAWSGNEILPLFFSDITKQKVDTNIKLFLRRDLTEEEKNLIFKNQVNFSSTGCMLNLDSQDIRIPLDYRIESILRDNMSGKVHTYQERFIHIGDSFYRKKEETIIRTLGNFYATYRKELLYHILDEQIKSNNLIDELVNSLDLVYEEILDSIDFRRERGRLSYEDINELYMLLSRSLIVSDFIKMEQSKKWLEVSFYLAGIKDNSIPSSGRYTSKNMLSGDSLLFYRDTISYEIFDLFKRNIETKAIKKAYFLSCFNDYNIHKDTIETLFSNRFDSIITFIEEKGKELSHLYQSGINKESELASQISKLIKIKDKKDEFKQELKKQWNKSYIDMIYNHPKNELDTLIFIKTPQIMHSILDDESVTEFHSLVEEISTYLYFSAFLRGYNVSDNVKSLKKHAEKTHRLMNFINYVDSMQSLCNEEIIKTIQEL